MTLDSTIKTNLELLDTILKCLIEDTPNYITSLEELYQKVFGYPIPSADKNGFINYVIIYGNNYNFEDFNFTSDNLKAQYLKFHFACNHLLSEGHISFDEKQRIVITYKGIIQYSKGFVKQYKLENHKTILDIYNVYISIGLTMIGLLVGYFLNK